MSFSVLRGPRYGRHPIGSSTVVPEVFLAGLNTTVPPRSSTSRTVPGLTCEGASQCTHRCIAEFGASEYRCHDPGGDKSQGGCLFPAPTSHCPSASRFADCKNRCEILLSDPKMAEHCATICEGGVAPPMGCECNGIANEQERCRCLAERDPQTGLPKCGSGVQCTAMERCLSYVPPTIEDATPLNSEDQAMREAECRSVPIPVVDQVVADRYFQAYKAGRWAGDPAWKGLDDETVRNLVFETLFVCQASVGAIQTLCGSQEQGLLAAWMALDPRGENAEQARAFLREDASLLTVILSDEDDCSSVDQGSLTDVSRCSCFVDRRGCKPDGTCDSGTPGPRYPAEGFVELSKSLKSDPSQVSFVAIVGDAIPGSTTSPAQDKNAIRSRFFECKCDTQLPSTAADTYVCLSARGKAGLGARYVKVAEDFGPDRGIVWNLCEDHWLEWPGVESIVVHQGGEWLLPSVYRWDLPEVPPHVAHLVS